MQMQQAYDMRKVRYEFQLMLSLEEQTMADFICCRDISKFSPGNFDLFVNECISTGKDQSMIKDGIYHYGTDETGRRYYVDTYSGLLLFEDDAKFYIAKEVYTSKHHDLLDAAHLREHLLSSEENRITRPMFPVDDTLPDLSYIGARVDQLFTTRIPEYRVSTRKELEDLVASLVNRLSECKLFRRMWFRGQRQEYIIHRSKGTLERLGMPREFVEMPSLLPSAARLSGDEAYETMRRMSIYWNTSFKIWMMSQAKNIPSTLQVDGTLYRELLRSIKPEKMVKLLYTCPYDIVEEYIHEKDDHPMWASVLASQQYGGYTSMLDVTNDLDVALFFTQSVLNKETGKYELCEHTDSNVIYLIADTRGSGTVDLSANIFANVPFDEIPPVPPRILNQHCGLLKGADMFSRNNYAYRIVAKIKIQGGEIETTKTVDEMFPSIEEDTLFQTYSYVEPHLTGLYG